MDTSGQTAEEGGPISGHILPPGNENCPTPKEDWEGFFHRERQLAEFDKRKAMEKVMEAKNREHKETELNEKQAKKPVTNPFNQKFKDAADAEAAKTTEYLGLVAKEANERNPKPEQPGPSKPPKDLLAKNRDAIMATIQNPSTLADFHKKKLGNQEADEAVTNLIERIINPGKKKAKLPRAYFFVGPSGSGKGHTVKSIANETKCLLLKIPPCFFDSKLDRITALFTIALEMATKERPVIIWFDECDSIFSDRNIAKLARLKEAMGDAKDTENVLPIFVTNHPYRISNKEFNARVLYLYFNELTREEKKELIVDEFAKMDCGGYKVDLTNDEWDTLLPLLDHMGGAHVLQGYCNQVASFADGDKNRKDDIIRLKDLMERVPKGSSSTDLSSTSQTSTDSQVPGMTADAVKSVTDWMVDTLQLAPVDPRSKEPRQVIILHDLLSDPEITPDYIGLALGASDMDKLRSSSLQLKINGKHPQQSNVVTNFEKCLKLALPGAVRFNREPGGKPDIALSRDPSNLSFPPFVQTSRNWTGRGHAIKNVQYCLAPPNPERDNGFVQELLGDRQGTVRDTVRVLVVENLLWDEEVVNKLLKIRVKPQLLSVRLLNRPQGINSPVLCTFAHPSGTPVPEFQMNQVAFEADYPAEYDRLVRPR